MVLSVDNISSRVVLINNTTYPKDDNMQNFPDGIESINMLSNLLVDSSILGIPKENVTILHNTLHDTIIKEGLATASEYAKDTIFIYYNGYIIVRKGKLFLATINSTRKKANINSISLQTVVDIISESKAEKKIFLFDVKYVLDNDDVSYKLEKIVKAQFNYFENELKNSFFLSVSPSKTYRNNDSQPTFTEILTNLIKEGLPNENTKIKISDLCQPLSNLLVKHQLPKVFKGKKTKKNDLIITYNKKFIKCKSLKEKADKLFDINDYYEALPLYQKAQKLYENNHEIIKKVEFINIIKLAENFSSDGNYINSRFAFEKAYKLINVPYAKRKTLEALEKIADEFYGKADYEMAKVHYEILVDGDKESKFYKRLKICIDEIKFSELAEEGDKFYFIYDYPNAFKFYEKALKINQDNRIVKRKEICRRFVEKEIEIRKEIEKELKDNSHQNYEKDLKINATNKENDLKKELEPKIRKEITNQLRIELETKLKEELKNKVVNEVRLELQKELTSKILQEANIQLNKKYEMQLWNSISKRQAIELFEYYISSFPKGFHVKDAQERISAIERTQKEEEIVDKPKKGKTFKKPTFEPPNLADIRQKEPNKQEVRQEREIENISFAPKKEKIPVETETDPEKLWVITEEKNTLEAYTHYVETIEDSRHIIDAYYMINKLNHDHDNEENTDVKNKINDTNASVQQEDPAVVKENTQKEASVIKVFQPDNSAYSYQEDKNEESLWQQALDVNNIGAYYNYLNTTSKKMYWDKAKQKITTLKKSNKNSESRDWEKAQLEDTIYSYKEYIKKYPLGSYYAKAMFKINKFEDS